MSFTGTCPGVVNVSIVGAPNATVAITQATAVGSFTVPVGVCAGATLDLSLPQLLSTFQLDATGNLNLSPTLPVNFCGVLVQGVDVGTCGVGHVAQIP